MISWLQVTSGRCPEECFWVVAQVVEQILSEAAKDNLKANTLEAIPGNQPGGLKSALIAVEGDNVSQFIAKWQGTIQWIGKSAYRPNHKRKNWFVGVSAFEPPQKEDWDAKEITVESMRASGPGGQHINKTESAIRVIHNPTGITAVAQEERSQHLNRKLALCRLFDKLKQEECYRLSKHTQNRWSQHNTLERGNPIRIYEGDAFRLQSRNHEKGVR
jgi:peptide chain release factor